MQRLNDNQTHMNGNNSKTLRTERMEPPLKRPRLSIFDRSPSGSELDHARHNNDIDLKHKFESIFTKYAQDFSGIGDEIDLMTGEVVVNNGHLESMETETDPGVDHLQGGFTSVGKSMLRAMAVSLNPDLPGPDDVLASIETIAENTAYTEEGSRSGSEGVCSDTLRTPTVSRSQSRSNDIEDHWPDTSVEPYNSDSDSLFEEEQLRSGSIDSLFEEKSGSSLSYLPDRLGERPQMEDTEATPQSTQNANHKDDIIARFGPYVGKEVLNLIGQHQQAHIEPAWRIPVKLDRPAPRPSTPNVLTSSNERSPESKRNKSLWKLPRSVRKSDSPVSSVAQRFREESIDPLQEDFHSEREDTMYQSQEGNSDNSSDSEFVDQYDSSRDDIVESAATGNCPYCKVDFGSKSGVMAHWDRWLRRHGKKVMKNDSHDLDVIKKIRSKALVRVRCPRLVVYDFRTMVELHEGAGLSFDHIVASKTLRTRKTGLQLQDVYNKHRTPPAWHDSSSKQSAWTETEEQTLREMCCNPLATMATLRRGLKGRDELEIGNHLAEIWLGQLRAVGGSLANPSQTIQMSDADRLRSAATNIADNTRKDIAAARAIEVKHEESEDELFAAS